MDCVQWPGPQCLAMASSKRNGTVLLTLFLLLTLLMAFVHTTSDRTGGAAALSTAYVYTSGAQGVTARGTDTVPSPRRRLDDEDADGYTNDEDDVDGDEVIRNEQTDEGGYAEGYAKDGALEGSNHLRDILDEDNPDIGRDPALLMCVHQSASTQILRKCFGVDRVVSA